MTLDPGDSTDYIVSHVANATVTNTATWTAAENAPGYTADDTIPYNFEDISGTGTNIPLGDDEVSGAIPIGFTFNYYGLDYTDIYVSSNGFLTVLSGQSNGCCSGQHYPTAGNPDGVIGGFWTDLNPSAGGTIEYQLMGTAPNRYLIIQITNIPHFSNSVPVTFQYKLFETSDNIEVHYQSADGDGSHVQSAGVENEDGSLGTEYFFGTGSIPASTAVRYTVNTVVTASDTDSATVTLNDPDIAVSPSSLSSTLPPDQTDTQDLTIQNNGIADLNWTIEEAAPLAHPPVQGDRADDREGPSRASSDGSRQLDPRRDGQGHRDTPPLRSGDRQAGSARQRASRQRGLPQPGSQPGQRPVRRLGLRAVRYRAAVDRRELHPDGVRPHRPTHVLGRLLPQPTPRSPPTRSGSSSTPIREASRVQWSTTRATSPRRRARPARSCSVSTSTCTTSRWAPGEPRRGHLLDRDVQRHHRKLGPVLLGDRESRRHPRRRGFGFAFTSTPATAWNLDPATDLSLLIDGPASPCYTPSDLPWVSEDVTSGTTTPGNSDVVQVTFDSTGLTAGTYSGVICVESNDPDSPLVEVPVTLTVPADLPFDDGFETGDTSRWSQVQP